MTFNHQRLEVGAGGVECRSMAGATGPNDDNVANVLHSQAPQRRATLDCQIQIWMQVAPASRRLSGGRTALSRLALFLLRSRLLAQRRLRRLRLAVRHPRDPLAFLPNRALSTHANPIDLQCQP